MYLVHGSVSIMLGVFLFCIVLLGARNPRHPRWASDTLIGNLYCPLIVAFGIGGIAVFGTSLYSFIAQGGERIDLLFSVLILLATLVGAKAMRVGKRITAFEKESLPAASRPRLQN